MSDRFYVSLTATCDETHLHGVLDRMSAVLPQIADAESGETVLAGLSLSFSRDDTVTAADGALPTVLPIAPGQQTEAPA